jgi:hypothetical protein
MPACAAIDAYDADKHFFKVAVHISTLFKSSKNHLSRLQFHFARKKVLSVAIDFFEFQNSMCKIKSDTLVHVQIIKISCTVPRNISQPDLRARRNRLLFVVVDRSGACGHPPVPGGQRNRYRDMQGTKSNKLINIRININNL